MGKFKRDSGKFAKLSSNQKSFIKDKVQQLGNLEAVKSFYNKRVLVDQYALFLAKKIYK
jgi:hypothetical protein